MSVTGVSQVRMPGGHGVSCCTERETSLAFRIKTVVLEGLRALAALLKKAGEGISFGIFRVVEWWSPRMGLRLEVFWLRVSHAFREKNQGNLHAKVQNLEEQNQALQNKVKDYELLRGENERLKAESARADLLDKKGQNLKTLEKATAKHRDQLRDLVTQLKKENIALKRKIKEGKPANFVESNAKLRAQVRQLNQQLQNVILHKQDMAPIQKKIEELAHCFPKGAKEQEKIRGLYKELIDLLVLQIGKASEKAKLADGHLPLGSAAKIHLNDLHERVLPSLQDHMKYVSSLLPCLETLLEEGGE